MCASACGGQAPAVLLNASGTGNARATLDSISKHGWDLHWTYDCSGARGVFVVDVFDADRTPDFAHPGVNEEGDKDSGVYHVPGGGRFYLEVTTTCKWTARVTASS